MITIINNNHVMGVLPDRLEDKICIGEPPPPGLQDLMRDTWTFGEGLINIRGFGLITDRLPHIHRFTRELRQAWNIIHFPGIENTWTRHRAYDRTWTILERIEKKKKSKEKKEKEFRDWINQILNYVFVHYKIGYILPQIKSSKNYRPPSAPICPLVR
jgi:hypothetical protein